MPHLLKEDQRKTIKIELKLPKYIFYFLIIGLSLSAGILFHLFGRVIVNCPYFNISRSFEKKQLNI